jgi:hypothetical protein
VLERLTKIKHSVAENLLSQLLGAATKAGTDIDHAIQVNSKRLKKAKVAAFVLRFFDVLSLVWAAAELRLNGNDAGKLYFVACNSASSGPLCK